MLNKIKAMLAVFTLVAIFSLLPTRVFADDVRVTATRDDIYYQLLEASNVNVIGNTMKKCIASIRGPGSTTAISASNVLKGSIFNGGMTDISTALWVENLTQGNGGDNGSIWCHQKDGSNIFVQFADVTGLSIEEMVCNGGRHRLLQRATISYSGGHSYAYIRDANDQNCSSFNDTGAQYVAAEDAADQFRSIYNTWRAGKISENPFLPTYDELGSFNNVDGYFSYLQDFNLYCEADTPVTKDDKDSATTYTGITKYTRDGNKIVAQKLYYHVTNNKSWSYSLSTDNSVKSCSGLLDRIAALETTNNGIPINGRTGGYENIILDELHDSCMDIKTSEGGNGWTELKTKLQEVIDDPESSEEAINKAQENLDKLNDIINNDKYVESSGSEDSDDGKIYQCANIDGLDINVEDYVPPAVDITDPESGGTGATTEGDPCYNAGVEGMSWILCPAINNMEYTASALDNTIQRWLSVEPELYNSGSSTYSVWEVMRNIANILMIIFLVVIIFSQLTGYGIDNYGVKRMLPRLIAMAILLNLSFIICQLAVDLSNILGVGLRNMFGSVGESLLAGSQFNMEEFIGNIITGIFAIVGVAGVAAPIGLSIVTAVSSGSTAMGVVIIVLALIMVIAAILLFFIMLGARMIMIIGCIAISPLAFACFILPNTQSLFKKWWDVFKAALIIFPICGALGGLSFLIKAIVVTTDGIHLWMMVVALIAPYLVFFLLPMLLKGALAAMGRVGGALTAMSTAFKGGVGRSQDAARNTNMYRSAQEQARRNMNRWSAGLDKNGNERKTSRFGRFVRGGERGIAQARAQYARDMDAQNRERNMMDTGFSAVMANVGARAAAEQVSDFEALIDNGKATVDDNGTERVVNSNDAKSVGAYHAEALRRYSTAQTTAERDRAMAQIKAAQNILSKTDKGRAQIQNNFEAALRNNQTAGLSDAASHLMGAYGDTYKAKNRGMHAMISDLSTSTLEGQSLSDIQNKLGSVAGGYNTYGTDKYTAESLANADDAALERLAGAIDDGSLSGDELKTLRSTAYEALEKSKTGNLHIKPEVAKMLNERIVGPNYTPEVVDSSRARIISHGAYEDSAGNVYHLREMDNGKYLDDSGFEVDITHFKKH